AHALALRLEDDCARCFRRAFRMCLAVLVRLGSRHSSASPRCYAGRGTIPKRLQRTSPSAVVLHFPRTPRLPRESCLVVPGLARGREVAALLFWTAALFMTLALASYAGDPTVTPLDPSAPVGPVELTGANWVGPVGASCARGVVVAIGVIAWVLPVELVLLG